MRQGPATLLHRRCQCPHGIRLHEHGGLEPAVRRLSHDWDDQARADQRLHRGGSGTAWIDDAYLGELLSRTPIPVRGTVSPRRRGQRAKSRNHLLPGEELAFKAKYTPGKDHIRIDGAIEDTASENSPRSDKALRVTYTLPVNAVGWQWGDYARRSRTISGGTYLYNTISWQQTSRYPFSTIYDDRSSLSIGVPLNQPRFFTTRYTTGGAFDNVRPGIEGGHQATIESYVLLYHLHLGSTGLSSRHTKIL